MILALSEIGFAYSGSAVPALRGTNLELDTALVTILVGNNGAGKSTLIRLLTGQLLGYSGSYTLDGAKADPRLGELLPRHRFGYVPDLPVMDPVMTGMETAEMAGSFRGMGREAILAELETYAALFDLEDWFRSVSSAAEPRSLGNYGRFRCGRRGYP